MGLHTVGHGTLTADELVAVLAGAGVGQTVDVRRHPGSRRHPHFAAAAMEQWLPASGIAYRWEEALGGRRSVPADSPDVALRNAAFRAYAAHMRSSAFRSALAGVLALAERGAVAVLCAESVWWRCHRRMLADTVVLVHGLEVVHLMHDGRHTAHAVTEGARVTADGVVYDAGQTLSLLDSS